MVGMATGGMDCPWTLGSCFACVSQPPCPQSPLNLNDFLPPDRPGPCFSPHAHPERFSHSFPARFHTPSHEAQLCPVRGCGAWISQPRFSSLPRPLTREEMASAALLACCPRHPGSLSFCPQHACALEHGKPACLSVSPADPSPAPLLFLSPVPSAQIAWIEVPIAPSCSRLSTYVCHQQLAPSQGVGFFL